MVMDVEVLLDPNEVPGGWDNPEAMGFASAVVYWSKTDRYHFFLHPESLFDLKQFLMGHLVVTFNGIKFDSRVILGNDREVLDTGRTLREPWGWRNCDLLLEYVKARFGDPDVGAAEKRLGDKAIHDGTFGLDGLAEGTLGRNKTGHGAHAPVLYRDGKYAELLEYNQEDVRLTRQLFEFMVNYGFVVDRAGRVVKVRL
jgi:hypothetical protein